MLMEMVLDLGVLIMGLEKGETEGLSGRCAESPTSGNHDWGCRGGHGNYGGGNCRSGINSDFGNYQQQSNYSR